MRVRTENGQRFRRVVAGSAVAIGLAAGSYGIASAARGTDTSPSAGNTNQSAPAAPDSQNPWGGQRSDETPLTGDALAKVTAAARGKVANATIVRVETDADGNAAYEAHIVKADGTRATVYVDKQFNVVSVESR
jgi:uncharacterized membrane protein YkoI